MGNENKVTIFSHHQLNATTTSPEIVPEVITTDPRLQRKIELAVIDRDGNSHRLSLYRPSSKKNGWYSRDVYSLKRGKWVYSHKDRKKYPQVPVAPHQACQFSIGPVTLWTRERLTDEEMQETKRLITGENN